MKKLILLFIIAIMAFSVAAESVRVGGYKVKYDQVIEGDSDYDGINDRTSYYLEDVLVFSAYDTDGDGKQDMWFTYANGTDMNVAMRDTTGDGKPENVLTYDEKGKILDEEERLNLPWGLLFLGGVVIAAILAYFSTRKKPEKKPVKRKKSKKKAKK